jgi:hypothetical protein
MCCKNDYSKRKIPSLKKGILLKNKNHVKRGEKSSLQAG